MKKYHNKKIQIDGYTFDSLKEGQMYRNLKLLEKGGRIRELVIHPRYTLIIGYKDLHKRKIRDITYSADFSFYDEEKKRFRVIDCKGMLTTVFKIKRTIFNKLMLNQGIELEYEI